MKRETAFIYSKTYLYGAKFVFTTRLSAFATGYFVLRQCRRGRDFGSERLKVAGNRELTIRRLVQVNFSRPAVGIVHGRDNVKCPCNSSEASL